jgi:hypothetical protein
MLLGDREFKRIDMKETIETFYLFLFIMFEFNYLKSLIRNDTGDSSKSFGLVCSVIVGSFIGIVIGIVLLYDGLVDGTLDSDLWMVGWFLVADSVFIFGGGLNKTLTEKWFGARRKREEE